MPVLRQCGARFGCEASERDWERDPGRGDAKDVSGVCGSVLPVRPTIRAAPPVDASGCHEKWRRVERDRPAGHCRHGRAGQEYGSQASCGTSLLSPPAQAESAAQMQEPGAKRKRATATDQRDGSRKQARAPRDKRGREHRDLQPQARGQVPGRKGRERPASANLTRAPLPDFQRDVCVSPVEHDDGQRVCKTIFDVANTNTEIFKASGYRLDNVWREVGPN